ncbi:MAG: hypothetical protein ACKO3G_18400 [Planctomycetaceae bacterium]
MPPDAARIASEAWWPRRGHGTWADSTLICRLARRSFVANVEEGSVDYEGLKRQLKWVDESGLTPPRFLYQCS